MSYLLDTHTLYWWLYFPEHLPETACKTLANPDVRVFVSAVSAYEMAYKHYRGRWPEVEPLVSDFEEIVAAEGFGLLPLSASHAIRAGSYGPEHRDPFDRMLAAQAMLERLVLVSKDKGLTGLGVEVMWG